MAETVNYDITQKVHHILRVNDIINDSISIRVDYGSTVHNFGGHFQNMHTGEIRFFPAIFQNASSQQNYQLPAEWVPYFPQTAEEDAEFEFVSGVIALDELRQLMLENCENIATLLSIASTHLHTVKIEDKYCYTSEDDESQEEVRDELVEWLQNQPSTFEVVLHDNFAYFTRAEEAMIFKLAFGG